MAKKNCRKSVTKNLATSYFTVRKTRRHAVCLSEKQVPMKLEGVRMKRSRWVAEIEHPKKKNVRMWIGSFATQEEASKAYQMRKMELEEIKFKDAVKKDKFVGDQEVEAFCDDGDDGVVVCDDQVMKGVDFDGEKNGVTIEGVRICLGSYTAQEEASKAYQSEKMEHEKLKLRAIARKDNLGDDQEVVSGHEESNAESLPDNSDVVVKLADFDDQVATLVGFDDANIVESRGESQSDDCDVSVNVIGSDDQAMEVIHIDYQAERSLSRRIVEQEAVDMLLQSGPILMDRYGCLLGEFSWMDDLSIV
ncbi:hypothetical protein DCAR_0104814 [Daucus carota subsp. sativus]|uniref:Uncharacterized protein n=1 Tax=Daucus carota subsp. sativus TaxID=79200 RepID=A0A166J4Y5_DAUCS|nr:hypothetical protein DCAR_0104814 [Daucus carota subsp. sativus]